ncbi:MAG: hypothetical protein M3Y08_04850 [Fibrobacterota bacterium]|nr:hypothetical protein [Fibrobacterota bacterium]
MRSLSVILSVVLLTALLPARAAQIGDLPGEDVSTGEVEKSQKKVKTRVPKAKRTTTWLAPAVEEQLSRDRSLIPLGMGALFVPTYTEPRREPEVAVLNRNGKLVKSGQTGQRILLDSGTYTLKFGSGTTIQQLPAEVVIEEGHTTVVPPEWGGLLVETLIANGEYFDGRYEVIRMEKWVNYGKGHGLKQERLQDIKVWLLPPGLYRISKPGEGFNSLRNYITVQINPGELSQVELVFDKEVGGDIVAGGIKALNARLRVGSYWTYGLRVGGNVNLNRKTDDADIRTENMQVSSDVRLRALFDNVRYLGVSELLLQDNFSKERGRRFSVTSDIAEVRTNWVRRFNDWLGPYIRTTVETHIFPRLIDQDTVFILQPDGSIFADTTRDFRAEPPFDPIRFREGAGVNVEFLSKYYMEAAAQVGIAARQTIVDASFTANDDKVYIKNESIYEIGAEGNLNATVRLGSQMALDLRLEMFAPNGNPSRLHLDDLTADFRFFLSRNLELGYIYQVKEAQQEAKNRFPSAHSLSLRLSFNY